ncbi:MAG TPA: hypothetical protein ACQGQG_09395, partial [Xylella sp.]
MAHTVVFNSVTLAFAHLYLQGSVFRLIRNSKAAKNCTRKLAVQLKDTPFIQLDNVSDTPLPKHP